MLLGRAITIQVDGTIIWTSSKWLVASLIPKAADERKEFSFVWALCYESFSIFKTAQANNLHNEIFCLFWKGSLLTHSAAVVFLFISNFLAKWDPSLMTRTSDWQVVGLAFYWWILWESFPHYVAAPVLGSKNTKLMKHRSTLELNIYQIPLKTRTFSNLLNVW